MINFKKHLFLVRHGETEFNKKGIIQGHVDSPLTDLGHEQIQQIAEKAKDLDIDVLVSSDLRRTVETAGIISKAIGIPITKTDEIFRERYFGSIEGKKGEEVKRRYPEYVNEDGMLILENEFPKAEPVDDFYERIIKGVEDLLNKYPNKNIMLVAHAGTLRVLYAYYHDVPINTVRNFYNPTNCLIENY